MRIVTKLIWFVVFIIIAVIAIVVVYKGLLNFEFADDIKYVNINYSSVGKDICLKFSDNDYSLDNCSGGDTLFAFNSSKKCNMHYSKDYNSVIFDCGLCSIKVVKFKEFSFNKIKFSNNNKDYVLINNSVFSTMEGLNKISFTFLDEKTIKFTKYLNDVLTDEEICNYKYGSDESMGLECSRFYGYSSFKLEKFEKNSVTIINRGNRVVFTLDN